MKKEIEVKYLDINVRELQTLLKKLGAKKLFDSIFEEWLFYKTEWSGRSGRIRIRKHGKVIKMAYKETLTSTLTGNFETEFVVDDLESATQFAKKMSPQRRHQQKRRISYELKGVMVDIDFWPRLPPMVEIEGPTKKIVEKMAKTLKLEKYERSELDAYWVYKKVYNINLDKVTELVF